MRLATDRLGRSAAAALLGVAGLLAACSPSIPSTPVASPAVATMQASPPAVGARLSVSLVGAIGCGTFPYSCRATLSVLEAGTVVDDTWRPPLTDPWWGPDWSTGTSTDRLDPAVVGNLPGLSIGSHRLVVSLLGSDDVPSYLPDGTVATDLLSRCSADVDVTPPTGAIPVVVTLNPDPGSFGGTCSIAIGP